MLRRISREGYGASPQWAGPRIEDPVSSGRLCQSLRTKME